MWLRKAQEWCRAMLVWIKRECMKLLLCQVTYCSSYGKSLTIKLSSLCSLSHSVQHAVRITGRWSRCFLCVSPRVIDACCVQLEIMSFFTWVSLLLEHLQFKWDAHQPPEAQLKTREESNPCLKKHFVVPSFLFVYQAPCGLDGSVAGTRASGIAFTGVDATSWNLISSRKGLENSSCHQSVACSHWKELLGI